MVNNHKSITAAGTVVMSVLGGIAILLVIIGAAFSPPVLTAPDCQQYFDAAVASARQRNLGNSAVQASAFETMAWVAIYNACRGAK